MQQVCLNGRVRLSIPRIDPSPTIPDWEWDGEGHGFWEGAMSTYHLELTIHRQDIQPSKPISIPATIPFTIPSLQRSTIIHRLVRGVQRDQRKRRCDVEEGGKAMFGVKVI